MTRSQLCDRLDRSPVIAAVRADRFQEALASPAEVIFRLDASLLTVQEEIAAAHAAGKAILVHMDLAEGVGKDRAGTSFLAAAGVDGIISTRGQLIRCAKECGLLTVQRFFALDSQGVDTIPELMHSSQPDLIEIMPGVVGKVIRRFAAGTAPVIAGGLVETKEDVTTALSCGAAAVSTGTPALWFV